MIKEVDLRLTPFEATEDIIIREKIAQRFDILPSAIKYVKPLKRSLDAREKPIIVHLKAEVYINEPAPVEIENSIEYPNVSKAKQAIVVGMGPAGMFAALQLIEKGIKPIILERGKDVQSRRRDLAAINKDHVVNPDSNYCFGEGGAGTYSDGKLYTRSTKRGDVSKILDILIAHGANENIAIETHPHIGTNKLPKIIQAMRDSILNAGGEIHFEQRVSDFIIDDNRITGVINQKGDCIDGIGVVLATGHSARDIYELLDKKNILIEAKPFAMGVRVEHNQELIDTIQYKCKTRGEYLPAASYNQRVQIDARGVYSFCMCPGGFIVPSATAPGEVVVNGMSPSKRDSPFSNSGIVVSIELDDLKKYANYRQLAGLQFQKELEQAAWVAGGKTQTAPAQRLVDFCTNTASSTLPDTSYQPGTNSVNMMEVLPSDLGRKLQKGFQQFGKRLRGYYTNEAIILGVESRTSSPVRIPRDKELLEHPQIKGLFPCGEGAGFAGGIISAAIDGERCAIALSNIC